MSDDIIDLIVRFLYLHQEDALTNYDNERDECRCGQQGDGPWNIHFADTILAALRERYAVVERPEPREVTVLKNAWWLDGDVTAVVGSGRVRCELEDHRLSSDEARALAAALLAAAAEADQ